MQDVKTLGYETIEDKRVVILQSGGLDSNILASIFKHYGFEMHHIFVNYGQNMLEKEREYSKKIAEYYGGTYQEVTIDLPWLKTSTVLVDNFVEEDNDDEEKPLGANECGVYVPMRNHLLLSISGSYAEAHNITNIACAFDGCEDFYGRPLGGTTDKHPTFVNAVELSLNEGSAIKHIDYKYLSILTPLMDMYKHEIIKVGEEFNADVSISWSCYNKSDKPCGTCPACVTRAEGFKMANVEDPSLK